MLAAGMAMPEDSNVSELDKEEEEEDLDTTKVSGSCLLWAWYWLWYLVGWCTKHLQQNQSVFNALELPPLLIPRQSIFFQPLSPPEHYYLCVGETCRWTIYRVLSKEGVAQGCTFGMYCYGIGQMPLPQRIHTEVKEALQVGFADDLSAAGHTGPNAQCMRFLVNNGPQYGYFPEEEKLIYICKGGMRKHPGLSLLQLGLTPESTAGGRGILWVSLGVGHWRRTSFGLRLTPGCLLLVSLPNWPYSTPKIFVWATLYVYSTSGNICADVCQTLPTFWNP